MLSHPNVHVDVYGVIYVDGKDGEDGKEFKIAIEHQGPQHYSLEVYTDMAREQDIRVGKYKTDAENKKMYDAQIKRDQAKVSLFEDLNKDGYYLIVVPYWVPPSERGSFILRDFRKQMSRARIADYL